ncbi:hypothetical protein V1264_018817 [Littorina saxatilis]|uniref:Uncharacterized protein n=1 Tax=Littorina saxatilis TaxID=31220 RepID=A0AAN9BDV9_9CAEN
MDVAEVLISRFTALCSVLGTVAFLIGFVTPWWLKASALDSTAGLWRNCVGDHCIAVVRLDIGDWLVACQSLAITVLITSLMTIAVLVAMVRASSDSTATNARYGAIATSLITGVTVTVVLLIYYFQHHVLYPEEHYTISFSFFLVLVGGCLFMAVAAILAIFSVTVKLRHLARNPS